MRFDLAPVKAAFDAQFGTGLWTIQSASLRLTTTPAGNAMFNANAAGQFNVGWMQNDSWIEGTGTPGTPTSAGITFNTLPSFLGPGDQALGTFSFPGGNSGNNAYTLTLSSGFTTDVVAGGLASMRLFAAGDTVSYLFNSRNFGTVANRPLLTIDAVPEPAAGLFAAVLGFSLLRRRRRQAACPSTCRAVRTLDSSVSMLNGLVM
jgi:MYXO-CTERM domain-containing protein